MKNNEIHLFRRGSHRFVAMAIASNMSRNPGWTYRRPLKFDPVWGVLRLCKVGEAATELRGEVSCPVHFVELRNRTLELSASLRSNSMQRDQPFWEDLAPIIALSFYRIGPDGELVGQANFNLGWDSKLWAEGCRMAGMQDSGQEDAGNNL